MWVWQSGCNEMSADHRETHPVRLWEYFHTSLLHPVLLSCDVSNILWCGGNSLCLAVWNSLCHVLEALITFLFPVKTKRKDVTEIKGSTFLKEWKVHKGTNIKVTNLQRKKSDDVNAKQSFHIERRLLCVSFYVNSLRSVVTQFVPPVGDMPPCLSKPQRTLGD